MLDKEMKIDKKAVGRRIFSIRQNMNLTLKDFGKIIGASKSSISEWENGKNLPPAKSIVSRWEKGVMLPNKSRLEKIAYLGDMSVNELLYGDIEKDVEELYQRLVKLPRGEFINLMMRVSIEFESEGEQEEC